MDELSTGFMWNLEAGAPARDRRLEDFERRVAALERELAGRIRREEGLGGFFAFLCLAAPRYLSFVGKLRAEHRDLLATLASLRRRIHAASSAELGVLAGEAAAVVAAIDAHEALEREILRDALDPV
jgi:hypothetical protein